MYRAAIECQIRRYEEFYAVLGYLKIVVEPGPLRHLNIGSYGRQVGKF